MPGTIQSIERAAAVLRLLGGAAGRSGCTRSPRRSTCRGAPRTASSARCYTVGLVEQDRDRRATSSARPRCTWHAALDANELRSRAMNWADALAARTGEAVRDRHSRRPRVRVVHHVFRPDGSPQTARRRAGACRCTPPRWASAAGLRADGRARAPASSRWRVHRPHLHDDRDARSTLGGGAPARVGASRSRSTRAARAVVGGADPRVRRARRRRDRHRRPRRAAAATADGRPRHRTGRRAAWPPRWRATRDLRSRCCRHDGTRTSPRSTRARRSTRCILFDHARPAGLASAQREHQQHYPQPGLGRARRRGDLAQRAAGRPRGAARRGLDARRGRRASASPTSARPPWCGTGAPAIPSRTPIIWQDTRTADARRASCAASPARRSFRDVAACRSGHRTSPRPRLRWLLDHVPGLRERAERGEVLFGTMETWLIWNLTGGPTAASHVTDVTNASRTMLMDLATLAVGRPSCWPLFDIPPRDAARDPRQRRGLRHVHDRAARGARSPARSATSRPRCSARPASPPARPSARTAPAASCCSTPARRSSGPRHGLLTTVGYQIAGEPRRSTRWRARSPSPARWSSGSATPSG